MDNEDDHQSAAEPLAAPPTAMDENSGAMKLMNALERVTAVPEGQELFAFLCAHNYSLEIAELPRGILAQCDGARRHINFNESLSADDMANFLPHEMFHAVQYESIPLFTNFVGSFQRGGKAFLKIGTDDGVFELLRPDEYHYAANLMEMAAYAVQADVVAKMGHRAGDKAASQSFAKTNFALKEAYDSACAYDEARSIYLQTSKRELASSSENIMDKYPHDVVATNFVARYWFWTHRRGIDGALGRLYYTEGHAAFLREQAESRQSYFNELGAQGYKFRFRHLTDEEIRAFGQGCGYDVFGLPEFDDVRKPEYRNAITDENRAEVNKMLAVLGLS